MLVNRALKLLSLAALFWSLTACQTNTKTRNELSFPSGIHTWQKGADYNLSQPTNDCAGCPEIVPTTPTRSSLAASGWRVMLDNGRSTFDLEGFIDQAGLSDCGPNNDLLCSNEWRIWPPNSDYQAGYVMTPGGGLPAQGGFELQPSFQCGVSRMVLVSENTYGLTRFILDVDRRGGVCEVIDEEPALNVRLVWDTENTDLDLHLVRDGGALYSSDDCYYENCGPVNSLGTSGLDWGDIDTEIDNPLLDVDDTERGGPENIFIHRAGDQFYDVYVDYYDGVTETLPEIEVWYGSELIDIVYYSANLPRFTQGGIWHAATVFVETEGVRVMDDAQTLSFSGR